MKIVKIDQNYPDKQIIQLADDLLINDEIIIHPTETVYGLAGIFSSDKAIQKSINIKGRPHDQPFSIMVKSVDEILETCGACEKWLELFLQKILPGAITVLIPRKKKLQQSFWNQFQLLGFRYPKHYLSNRLLGEVNQPLITTSANFSRKQPPIKIEDISENIISAVSLVLDGGETEKKIPSTIIKIDIDKQKIILVRKGAVPWNRIEKRFTQ